MFNVKAFFVSLLLLSPLLVILAHTPQSPDGAEMVWTSVNGGVLHPSGMPLQAWVNWWAVRLIPGSAAWVLSVVSWLGAVGTATFLIATLRRIGVGLTEGAMAAVAYTYIPVVALMSVVPEKYTWLTFTQTSFIYMLVRYTTARAWRVPAGILLGFSLALALAQHSANVILIPAYLYVQIRLFFVDREKVGRPLVSLVLSLGSLVAVAGLFYLSLLFLTSAHPWPDWGKLQSVSDVVAHALRRDFEYVRLFDAEKAQGYDRRAAFILLAKGLVATNLAFLFVFVGYFALTRTQPGRFLWALLLMILLPGFAVLSLTAMPGHDVDTALGYQERYPLLVWPILLLYWGVGLSWCVKRWPTYRYWIRGVVAVALTVFAWQGFRAAAFAKNNWTDLYRDQARYELDDFNIFWSGSDFVAFLGVPTASSVIFPVKNLLGLEWYRERVLPELSPAVLRVFRDHRPQTLPALFRQLLREDFKITVTEPTALLKEADLMAQAEQTGVLWTFSSSNRALYSKKIVVNSLHLCSVLDRAERGLPLDGLYFLREILNQFRYTFLSAADYLQAQMELSASSAARNVAETLQPGREPADWRAACATYVAIMQGN